MLRFVCGSSCCAADAQVHKVHKVPSTQERGCTYPPCAGLSLLQLHAAARSPTRGFPSPFLGKSVTHVGSATGESGGSGRRKSLRAVVPVARLLSRLLKGVSRSCQVLSASVLSKHLTSRRLITPARTGGGLNRTACGPFWVPRRDGLHIICTEGRATLLHVCERVRSASGFGVAVHPLSTAFATFWSRLRVSSGETLSLGDLALFGKWMCLVPRAIP